MGTTLKIRPNRYNALHAIDSLSADTDTAEVRVSADHDIYLNLAAPTETPSPEVLDLARLALGNLPALDLVVQKGCAEACKWTKLDSRNFESWLAGMSITTDTIKLHYWGDVVNTEWDEVFSLVERKWIHTASGTGPGTGVEIDLTLGEQESISTDISNEHPSRLRLVADLVPVTRACFWLGVLWFALGTAITIIPGGVQMWFTIAGLLTAFGLFVPQPRYYRIAAFVLIGLSTFVAIAGHKQSIKVSSVFRASP